VLVFLIYINKLSSIGALLDHLTRERAVGNLGDEGVGGLEIRGIETFTM
jgi:DNA mismatch repair protein MSH5